MPRFYTHSAILGDVPLKARTDDWPDQTMDVLATHEEVAVSIDVDPRHPSDPTLNHTLRAQQGVRNREESPP